MQNQALVRGMALIAIALLFGIPAASYPIGTLGRAGPGLFPLIVSGLVGLIGIVTIVGARLRPSEPLQLGARNILIVLASLVGFSLISRWVNVSVATVYLVFVSSLAGGHFSLKRNLQISAVLILIGFAFHRFLGLQLHMW